MLEKYVYENTCEHKKYITGNVIELTSVVTKIDCAAYSGSERYLSANTDKFVCDGIAICNATTDSITILTF